MLNAHEFNLFITPGSLPPVLHMGQYDSGRQWTAHLKDQNGDDFTPPSGSATATIAGTNKKRVSWILNADISGSSVTFTPEGAATDQYGKMQVTLTIEDNGEQITALALIFDIQKAGVTNEEAATSPEFETAMQAAAAEAVEDAMTEAGVLLAANQDTKSNSMTQPVGVDGNGKLWVQPVGSEGAVTPDALLAAASQLTTAQEATLRADIGAGTYSKPTAGIPKNDLASAVRTSLDKADSAVQPADLAAYVPRGQQATKSSGQTQAVGIDANGKLWVEPPGSGGGGGTVERFNVHITDTGNGYVSDKSFTQISVADAAGQIIVPSYNYFEGRVIKLTDSYAIVAIVDLTLPQIPILWTFTITDTGTNGYGTDIGGAAYVYLTESGGVYDIDPNYTPEILRTRQNILNYFYDGIAVKLMVNGYAHPLVYHYGDGILQFGGPEYVTVDGHLVARNVSYTWSMSTHIAREVATPVAAELLAAKTGAMTQAVGYDANTGTLWTAPGSGGGSYTGPVIPVPASADDGHILTGNADGSTRWAARETIQLVPDNIGFVSIAGDYMTVTKKFTRPNPARVICATPDTSSTNLEGIEMRLEWFNDTTQAMMLVGIHGAKEYFATLTLGGTSSNRVMTGVLSWRTLGNASEPSVVPKTGASQSFSVADNTIYECETLTALTVTSVPATATSLITFTSGSTATNASFPATVLFSDDQPDVTNGAFVPAANYFYEINIRNRKALITRWAVSA